MVDEVHAPWSRTAGGVDGEPAASMGFMRRKLMGRGACEAIGAAASEPAVAAGCAAAWLKERRVALLAKGIREQPNIYGR